MWVRRIFISVLLLIGLPLLGVAGGFALLSGWNRLEARQWQALGTPPAMPVEIVDGQLDEVCVRTQDGSLYICDHTGPTRDNACWQEVDQVGDRYAGADHETYRMHRESPPPPGPAIQTLDVSWHFAERATYARYALLDDGSVWLWDYHADANWSLLLLACGPISGLVLALVIVAVWWGGAGLRALWRRRQAKTGS